MYFKSSSYLRVLFLAYLKEDYTKTVFTDSVFPKVLQRMFLKTAISYFILKSRGVCVCIYMRVCVEGEGVLSKNSVTGQRRLFSG